jgi:TetR/AcrR family transcriptional regulator
MIDSSEQTTEEKILNSATAIFVREGYSGARMQAIADHAGINKALLHYYFRSKENLFERIFRDKYQMFLPKLQGLLDENLSFIAMIDRVVDTYIDMMTANPYLPALMISTLSHHPEFIEKIPRTVPIELVQRFENEAKAGRIKPINFLFRYLVCVWVRMLPNL